MKRCSVEGCERKYSAKGYCRFHYIRYLRTGDLGIGKPSAQRPEDVRFWDRVAVAGEDECWNWTGQRDKDGYGKFRPKGENMRPAHRFSYRLRFGDFDQSLVVRHLCNNPACVNPKHLALGTHADNMLDRQLAGNYKTGEKAPSARLSNEIAALIRQSTEAYKIVAERFGCSVSQVGNIRRGDQRARDGAA